MRKKLKEHRTEKGITKEQMAEKLEISLKEYKKIESKKDYKIKKNLKDKIKITISVNKESRLDKIKRPFDKLYSPNYDDMFPQSFKKTFETFTYNSPLLDMMDRINKPINNLLNENKSFIKGTSFYLSDIDYLKPLKGLGAIVAMENWNKTITLSSLNKTSVFQDFLDKKMLNGLSDSIKSIGNISNLIRTTTEFDDILSPSKYVANAISNNKNLYNDYLTFNSHLSKVISPSIKRYTNIFPEELYKNTQGLKAYKTFSGSSFLAFTHFKDFDKEIEVLEEIESDPKLKKEANEFLKELSELINEVPEENKNYDFSIFQKFYSGFSLWIELTFLKATEEAQLIAQVLVVNSKLLFSVIGMSIALNSAESNRIQHKSTQSNLITIKKEQFASKERDKLILEKIKFSKKKNLIAVNDANLRKSNKKRSKSLGIVKKDQIVEILEYKIKWVRVAYEDLLTNEPMSGWVHISSFDIQK